MPDRKKRRYSISVSSHIYDRLRAATPNSVARLVDILVLSALDDPKITTRLIDRCRSHEET